MSEAGWSKRIHLSCLFRIVCPYAASRFIHVPLPLASLKNKQRLGIRNYKAWVKSSTLPPIFLLPRYQWWQPCLGHVTCRFCQETNINWDLSKPISLSGKNKRKHLSSPIWTPKIKQFQPDSSKTWPFQSQTVLANFYGTNDHWCFFIWGRYLPMHWTAGAFRLPSTNVLDWMCTLRRWCLQQTYGTNVNSRTLFSIRCVSNLYIYIYQITFQRHI